MAKTNKRQRKKNAKTKARKGLLYQPRPTNRNIEIKSVDIDPNNKYQQELLSVAQFNLFQLDRYVWNKIELEVVDIDTLKWLSGNEFRKIIDQIRNWARFDPSYYVNRTSGYITNRISKAISKRLEILNHQSGTRIIGAMHKVVRDLRDAMEDATRGKKTKVNPFVLVAYNDEAQY